MVQAKPSPREALMRWLAQLQYNAIRNIETVITEVEQRPSFRAFRIADDLCITRNRVFYQIIGKKAVQISIADVSANYNLEQMQTRYRSAVDTWKNFMRSKNRKHA